MRNRARAESTQQSERHWLVVAASTLIALGVLVGVAKAGTFSGGQATGRAGGRWVSRPGKAGPPWQLPGHGRPFS